MNNNTTLTEWYTVTEILNHKVTNAGTFKFSTKAEAIDHALAVKNSRFNRPALGTVFVIEHSSGSTTDVIR